MEPLDNPVWHALTGPQAAVALGHGTARRFRPEIDPVGGLPDRLTSEAWRSLLHLVDGGSIVLIRREIEVPPFWNVRYRGHVHQMVASKPAHRIDGVRFEELTSADDEDMLALAQSTEPGPFAIHTRMLGTYLGVRAGSRLVAMAGQRLRLSGYTEISSVCTAPDHRGRGLATALTAELCARISEAGDTPFLHVADDNEEARRIYERMGFRTRQMLDVVMVAPPGPRE